VELRSTQGGTAIATFGVAVNDRRKNPQTGEWEDSPNYVDCVMFGKRAEGIGNFIGKGSKVAIEGKLRWSQWQDKSGQKRSKLEVVVDEIEFMSQRRGEAQNGARPSQANNYTNQYRNAANTAPQQPQTGYQQSTGYQSDLSDTPIPF
jgi:single-strand DNA-binding protein